MMSGRDYVINGRGQQHQVTNQYNQAKHQKQRNHIDIIILDMVMPDLGGKAVYEKLKKINPDVKVLLSSGYGMDGQVADILNCGCDGFIQKPFNLKGLSLKVREVLDRKPSDGDLPRFQ